MDAQLHVRTSNDNSVYGIFSCVKFILLVTENHYLKEISVRILLTGDSWWGQIIETLLTSVQ